LRSCITLENGSAHAFCFTSYRCTAIVSSSLRSTVASVSSVCSWCPVANTCSMLDTSGRSCIAAKNATKSVLLESLSRLFPCTKASGNFVIR
jgi:hypothetical protein